MKINRDKLTKEFCEEALSSGIDLIFFPKTNGEARAIQTYLFSMGYKLPIKINEDAIVLMCKQAVALGMVLRKNEKIYVQPNKNTFKSSILCELEQFADDYSPPITLNEFNSLVARVVSIDENIKPKILDKKQFKVKGPR